MDHRACANSKVRKHYMKPAWTTDEGIIGVWRGEYLTRWQFMDTFERESLKFWCYYGKMFNDHYFKQSVASKIRQRDRVLRNRYPLKHSYHYIKNGCCRNIICIYDLHLPDLLNPSRKPLYTIIRETQYGYKLPQYGNLVDLENQQKIWL